MQRRKKRRKTIISFSIYSHKRFQQPQKQDYDGQFPRDHLTSKGQIFVLASGINGHAEGRQASEMVVNIVNQIYYSDPSIDIVTSLRKAFKEVNTLLHELFNQNGRSQKLGISCTALVLTKERVCLAHIGDNRAYRITSRKIEKLTSSNALVGKTQKRSKLNLALGLEPSVHIDINRTIPFKTDDSYLLCTHGLVNVDAQKIKDVVLSNTPKQACTKLIRYAAKSGCTDNVNIQVIRINSVPHKHSWATRITPKLALTKRIRRLYAGLPLILGVAAFVLYSANVKLPIQKVQLLELLHLQDGDVFVKQPNPFEQRMAENAKANMIAEANRLFHAGKLDSALTIYQAVLQSGPMHLGTIYGIDQIAEAYKNQGDLFYQKAYYEKALEFYQKAAQLQPTNEALEKRISESKKKFKPVTSSNNLAVGQDEHKINSDSSLTSQFIAKNFSSVGRLDILRGLQSDEWNLQHLTKRDYEAKQDRIIFLDSPNIKKVLYRNALADFNMRANAEVSGNSLKGRYGIIVGYKTYDESPYETFYLFSVSGQKQLLLQKYSNFRKELIFSIPAEADSLNNLRNIEFGVKCQGPYMILYANGKRLRVCYGYETIKGRVGLYADPNIHVEFSKVEISKALDSKSR
ncbi:MAG: tetratricopeptide repeat protein [bacterium]